MDAIINLISYFGENWSMLLQLTFEHILLVVCGIAVALLIGIPLGIICAKNEKLASIILAIANMIQVFPSLALLAVLLLIFGLGFKTVVVTLILYSLLPIIRNTYVGLKEVDPSATKAGKGMGMTNLQLLIKVQFPLSLPFLLAGTRVAVVIAIGVATLAPFVGGDGLGKEIYGGLSLNQPVKIYAGAIVASVMAIIADFLLGRAQKQLER